MMDFIQSIWKNPLIEEFFNSTLAQNVAKTINKVETNLEPYSRIQLIFCSLIFYCAFSFLYEIFEDGNFTWKYILGRLFRLFINLPFIRSIAQKEFKKIDKTINDECKAMYGSDKFLLNIPKDGLNTSEIYKKVIKYLDLSKVDYKHGKVSGAVYSKLSDEWLELMRDIYYKTSYTNPLHPEIFPGISKMEAEVIRIVINLFNGDKNCCGCLTSGGTESILMAMKAYRDYGKNVKGIKKPVLVLPVTAHAAFLKACQYFNIKYKPIPIDPTTGKVDIKAMKRAITGNTIALVGSACEFAHGIVDDIQSIAKLGLQYDIPVHVDCCLGGFLLPFVKPAGFDIDTVDFTVKGITSISVDTHKYGFTPKGSSLVLYSDVKYRNFQYFVHTDWPGGIYASPTIAGSRAGANVATCWATLNYYGYNGYLNAVKNILTAQRFLKNELKNIPGLNIIGDPMLSVIAFNSDEFDIFRVSDLLTEKGWNINPLQFPSAIHICLTNQHTEQSVLNQFVKDVKEAVDISRNEPNVKNDGRGAIYGMAQRIPDRSLVSSIAFQYLNSLYSTEE